MTNKQNNLDAQIQALSSKSDEELLEIMGAYSLSQQPNDLRESLAADGVIDMTRFKKAGEKFRADMEPYLREAICGSGGLLSNTENVTVQDILMILLPIIGMTMEGMVPTAIIAICIVVIRVGLRKFCKEAIN